MSSKVKVKKYKVKGKRLGLATANLMSMNESGMRIISIGDR